MDLAVRGDQITGGGEDERGVVERPLGVALGDRAGVQPHARVAGGLGHGLVRRPLDRLGLRAELLVGEGSRRPQLRQHHEVGADLLPHQRDRPLPTFLDRFALVYGDLDQRGAHTTTVLAFDPSTQAYDRHTKPLPGCLTAA
ncbi:hypothetical protein GCM10020295_40710 [Streptomyces cinereospinus]